MPTSELDALARELLDAVPAGIVHVALDGSILRANERACRLLGYSFDALSSRFTRDWEPETILEDGSKCRNEDYPVVQALATGEVPPPRTIGVRRPEGDWVWAVFSARPIRDPETGLTTSAVVAFVDTTEKRQVDTALLVSEARLRSVLESAPDYILTADLDGTILFLNRSVPPYSVKDFIGRSIYDQVAPEEVAKVRDAVHRVVTTGAVVSYETRPNSALGDFVFHVQVGAVRTDGKIVGITFATRDLTEHRRLQLRLSIADRMASIGQLAAGVAHEINNPLTYVMASLEQIRRSLVTSGAVDAVASQLAAAEEGLARIRSVVRDLSSFSRSNAGERGILEVVPVLESAIRMAHAELATSTTVTRDYGPAPHVFANEARLGQVFLNLVVNAAQAMSERRDRPHELHVATRTGEHGECVVVVRDTGAGIPEDLRKTIFDPFVTTKPPGVGTGLGLSICRDILTSLGGSISVESTLDVGTTFTVVLPPIDPELVRRASARRPVGEPAPSHSRRILVVDDEPAIVSALLGMLAGHVVQGAASGADALDMLRDQDFDVVLCDVMMRDVSGIDVFEFLAREGRGRERRVIFMTGNAFTDEAREFLRSKVDRVLEKPFVQDDVVRMVARVS
ncbi:MAG: PAS domain S-box protein [Polyangiaceae bacterium]